MRRELGLKGEAIAEKYLKKKGYKIITKNYHTRYGEIDIICEKNNTLIFVEVKTRRSNNYGTPEEAITFRKREHLKKAALIYMDKVNTFYKDIRFDVIGIIIQGENTEINHVKNAF